MLAFDIGGTFIKYAVISNDQVVLEKGKFPTPGGQEIAKLLAQKFDALNEKYEIKGIGVSTAGFVNAETGLITYSANIPNYAGVNLIEELEAYTDQKVVIDNDVTSCLYNFDTDSCLYLAVGTGIGGGLIANNNVFRGNAYSEMEIGHTHLRDGKSFEQLCSTHALLNRYYELTKQKLTGEELDKLYIANDETVHQLIGDYMDDFATALVNFVYILDPKEIIIGGGVSEAEMFDIELLNQKFIEKCTMLAGRIIPITKSKLGNDAAFLGIAAKHRKVYL